MVTYEFYVNQYLGSAIPEKVFSGMAARAEQVLNRFQQSYRVESSGKEAESMAICAMAESLWQNRNKGLSSANIGSVSVQYETDRKALRRELYDKACIYLDIYRGVG
ncbi:MAG: hypothetical protein IJZ14_03235 [Oscillospiraceae bacterium]|nr:hypothetical protein [Oscillospiraceae bacterium]